MQSTKYSIAHINNQQSSLAIIEAEINDSDPNHIALPLYFRNIETPDQVDISKYKVIGNNTAEQYEIIELTGTPQKPILIVRLLEP